MTDKKNTLNGSQGDDLQVAEAVRMLSDRVDGVETRVTTLEILAEKNEMKNDHYDEIIDFLKDVIKSNNDRIKSNDELLKSQIKNCNDSRLACNQRQYETLEKINKNELLDKEQSHSIEKEKGKLSKKFKEGGISTWWSLALVGGTILVTSFANWVITFIQTMGS